MLVRTYVKPACLLIVENVTSSVVRRTFNRLSLLTVIEWTRSVLNLRRRGRDNELPM